jgi:hypothetical protein
LTPIHRIAKTMAEEHVLRKLNRDEYSRWKQNQEAARKRAEELRRK